MSPDESEAELRLRQLRGETPGPAGAKQEARVGPDTQKRASDGAEEPAPGEANKRAEHEGRGGDQRESTYEEGR